MKQDKEVTIYDIAKALNISAATVSRGLKDNPAINKVTKKKIFDAARDMGYRFNTFASNLRLQRTNTIGVIVPRLNSSFMSDVIAGIEKVANEAGYNLIISQSLETVKKEIANTVTMFNNRVDGLLVSLSYNTSNIDHFEPFINRGVPLLFFDRVYDHNKCPNIIIDNYKAAFEAVQHLIEQGCRRIVHITGNQSRNVYLNRFEGYRKALEANSLSFDDSLLIINNLTGEEGILSAKQILAMEERPDGVFVANDFCAVHCMAELKRNGIRIPQDIAFVGFNNDRITDVVEPNLTSVNYPGSEMGELAAKTLINHLNNQQDINLTHTLVLRHELKVRASSLRKI